MIYLAVRRIGPVHVWAFARAYINVVALPRRIYFQLITIKSSKTFCRVGQNVSGRTRKLTHRLIFLELRTKQ